MGRFSSIKYVDDPLFECHGKRVLVRVDFNVPQDDAGLITNDKRIRESLPTINLLRQKGAKVILMSHLGRPKGKPNAKYSLKTVSLRLAELLGAPVQMAPDCVGQFVADLTRKLQPGEVLLLENVRFHEREEGDAASFGKDLAPNGDIFVNDAFGTSHRDQGSVTGVAKLLPHFGGLLIKKELEFFGPLLDGPEGPYVAVMGGAKVADKIGVIKTLMDKVDTLIIGGGMAYTFLAAQGVPIGKSLLDAASVDFAKAMIKQAGLAGVELLLPVDHIVSHGMDDEAAHVTETIEPNYAAFDIGPATMALYTKAIDKARTVVFNGPMGVFEKSRFSSGTRAVLDAMAEAHERGATVVIGGGDSAAAAEEFGFEDEVSHVSTGGGASLELLEGKDLPGLSVLMR